MKKIISTGALSFLLLFPGLVSAEGFTGLGDSVPNYLATIAGFIFGPLLTFLLALAFIAFAWGVIKYFISDAEGDKGAAKSLMLWGILGFVLILILFGAVNLLVDFTGLGEDELQSLPTAPKAGGE